ncbi:MAG TPA: amino acid adenylation domain-containing protein [Longimicrobium sp.]
MSVASEIQHAPGTPGEDAKIGGPAAQVDGESSLAGVEAWNRTEAPYPAERCIHQLFEEQARRTPHAVAVVHEHDALTYAELDTRANRLAHHLARLGVGPEVRVGVCLERGVGLVVGLMAVLKAGGAYVPLDPAYPAERLAFMLADSGAGVLLTQEKLRHLPGAPHGTRVVSVDGAAAAIAREPGTNPDRGAAPRNLAYLIYTSGSTGVPKGVAIEHQSAVAMLAWAWSVYSDDELGGMLACTSVCFDMSVFELFAPLGRGGRVIVVENALALPRSAAAAQVRLVDTVPSAAAALLDAGGLPAGVRTVNLGGELLRPELVDALYAAGVERVYDLYGPSEDTTFSTYALRVPGGAPTIGRPLANAKCHVVDAALRPLAPGEAGELYMAGAGVTRGYLGRPRLTAERFVPDPFSARPGARMYRTGDRVRWRGDGTLEYLGRLDHQVKVRGFRVELGEVEAALRRHPAVRDCVVAARRDGPAGETLAAYVVAAAGTDADADAGELRGHLRRTLPDYMLPGAFVFLASLPLTPNGKVDRAALPAPHPAAAEGDGDIVPPATETEAALARIWCGLLGVERVSVDAPFLELGAHSLLGIRALARIEDAFGVRVPLHVLLGSGTIREVAAVVDGARGTARDATLPVLQRVPRDRPLPLSFSQQATWFFEQFSPGQLAYRAQATFRFRGPLDVAALERALTEIVRRHEIFRTTFPVENGEPVQRIHAPWPVHLPPHDLSDVDADRRDDALREIVDRELRHPISVTELPLLWLSLVRVGPRDHVLVMVEHHFVHDGWSFGVFLRELRTLYLAYAAGRESPLAEPALQFADFAVWQRRWMESETAQEKLRFWEKELAAVPALELATDFPRPAVMRFRGARERVYLPPALVAAARAFSTAHGVTFFTTLMTAFQALMARHTGQRDFCVGSGLGNRGQVALEGVIGMVVNTVAIRAGLDGDPTGTELLRRVREATLRAGEHQDVPFDQVVARLRPERSASALPVYQVSFAAHDSPMADLSWGDVQVELADVLDNGSAKFDMQVTVVPRLEQGIPGLEHEVVLVWEYDTDLFERATLQRMARQYQTLLEGLIRDPGLRLSELPLLQADERRRVVEEWNRTAARHPAGRTVVDLFREQAHRAQNAPAVAWDDAAPITYGELDACTNRLARRLARLGVGPESRVGVCLERGPELPAALLAVLKAGGAYVPLDPAHPAERLEHVLADCGVGVLLTQRKLRAGLPSPAGVRVVELDGGDAFAAESAEPLEGRPAPESLAYVIYTSGSTGTPKGVAVEHRALANHMAWFVRDFALGADDRVLQKTPIGFDAAGWEVYAPLLTGGVLVMAAHGGERDPRYLVRTLRDQRITTLQLVPSLLRALLDEPELAECAALRRVFCGGEALPGELARRFGELLPHASLVNLYGPTECCIDASTHLCGDGDGRRAVVSIGRPVANTRAYVLDEALRPAPVGVPGELYLGGAQVARGYVGRPALTAERFVPDAFGAEPGARLYRTGDRARWRADGALEYLGRLDAQVKVRGFRIEPGEIEAALRRHAGVVDCAVIARDDAPGDRRLVAYVAGAADADALRAHLRRTLPEYMVPAAFVAVDALPLTPNGKLDRRALPAPEYAAHEAFAAPRTPAEEVLAGIWAEVLRTDRVGVNDNFFALGGHSLLATRVASRIRAVLGAEVPLRVLFERPTVAQLAQAVEEARRDGLPVPPPVVPIDRTRPLPLSFAQERLWFLDRLQPHDAAYNVARVLRVAGPLDVPALERALGDVVRRHEALRTTFREADDAAVQVIAPFAGFALPVDDVSGLDGAAREAEVQRRAAAEAARTFDLSAGPLFRPALLRLGDEDHVLLLTMHHVVSDEWSMDVLFRELSALYAAYRDGRESPLPEPAVQYADFAVWQREQLGGEALDGQLAWWKERLAGAPALLALPTDRPRPAVRTHRGAREFFDLPAELLDALQALGRGEGATLYMVLLGAFQVLLAKYAGTDDVVVGSPVAGRTRRETEELIGFFANTLVLRTDLSGDPAFRQVLARVRETTLGAYDRQEVPFERLVAELQPERSRSHSPLFQVLFSLENAGRAEHTLPGVELRRVDARRETAKYDLMLTLAAQPHGLRGVVTYSTELFERATVQRMIGHLRRVLEQVAAEADTPLSALELADDAERRRVLEAWSGADAPRPPAPICVHRRFAEQAARTPEAVAVTCGARSLTYRQLDERANRLARHLVRLGVGTDARVGICLERGPELVTAVLAVLKAGGAYLPVDPGSPAARLEMMLADAGAGVLLTQERLRAGLPALPGVAVLEVDGAGEADEGESTAPLPDTASAESLAYVIYTSGSTGTPKGVGVTHGALANYLAWFDRAVLGEEGFALPLVSRPSFDAHVRPLFSPLLRGQDVWVLREETVADPAALLAALDARGGRVGFGGVPSLWGAMVELMEAGEAPRPRGLVSVHVGGEALPPRLAERTFALFPGVALRNHYGPTEVTVNASVARVRPGGAVGIGRPVAGARVYPLDARGRPVPLGIPGELYVGGPGVARGYLGRPGLTAERFLPDPFSAEPGARMYRTGDRVRWTDGSAEVRECVSAEGEDGGTHALTHSRTPALQYLGRVDAQVKVRGFRIEPGEIEAALRRQAGVRECAVVAREDAPGQARLVAYLVGDADVDALRGELGRTLPDYMVPSVFVALERLPLMPNGKLDRAALPAPDLSADGERYVAPRNPVEEVLAGIWADVLGHARVGVRDDFFALGGHSLLAVKVVSRIRGALDGGIGVVALFDNPTIDGLARFLLDRQSTGVVGGGGGRIAVAGAARVLAELDDLSDEELDRLLAASPETPVSE